MIVTSRVRSKGMRRSQLALYKAKLGRKLDAGQEAAAHVLMQASLKLVPRDTEALADSAVIARTGAGLNAVHYVGYGLKESVGKVIFGKEGIYVKEDVWSPREQRNVTRKPYLYAKKQHWLPYKHTNGQSHFLSEPISTKKEEMRIALRQKLSASV